MTTDADVDLADVEAPTDFDWNGNPYTTTETLHSHHDGWHVIARRNGAGPPIAFALTFGPDGLKITVIPD